MPSPNIGSVDNILYAVAAISKDDVWAVGRSQQEARTLRSALLLRLRKGAKIDVNQKYLNQRQQGGGDQQQAG